MQCDQENHELGSCGSVVSARPMDYASSGVDIDLEGEAVGALVGALSLSTRPKGSIGAPVDLPGGFGLSLIHI